MLTSGMAAAVVAAQADGPTPAAAQVDGPMAAPAPVLVPAAVPVPVLVPAAVPVLVPAAVPDPAGTQMLGPAAHRPMRTDASLRWLTESQAALFVVGRAHLTEHRTEQGLEVSVGVVFM